LSTVDRRTRERFIESSAQIAALVDKFKLEGQEFRKFANQPPVMKMNGPMSIPLTAYGQASTCSVLFALIGRQFSSNFLTSRLALRLGLIPMFALALYTFISPSLADSQSAFQTKSSIIFSLLAGITFLTPVLTTNYCKYSSTF